MVAPMRKPDTETFVATSLSKSPIFLLSFLDNIMFRPLFTIPMLLARWCHRSISSHIHETGFAVGFGSSWVDFLHVFQEGSPLRASTRKDLSTFWALESQHWNDSPKACIRFLLLDPFFEPFWLPEGVHSSEYFCSSSASCDP